MTKPDIEGSKGVTLRMREQITLNSTPPVSFISQASYTHSDLVMKHQTWRHYSFYQWSACLLMAYLLILSSTAILSTSPTSINVSPSNCTQSLLIIEETKESWAYEQGLFSEGSRAMTEINNILSARNLLCDNKGRFTYNTPGVLATCSACSNKG